MFIAGVGNPPLTLEQGGICVCVCVVEGRGGEENLDHKLTTQMVRTLNAYYLVFGMHLLNWKSLGGREK